MSHYHFKKRDPRATCQICGFDFNRSQLRKNWRGLWVCPQDYEVRNAQDFVRGVKDPQKVRGGAVPPAADTFNVSYLNRETDQPYLRERGGAINRES